jgi:intracellular septation protein
VTNTDLPETADEKAQTSGDGQGQRLNPTAKFLVEFGPIAVFFVVYFFGKKLAPIFGQLFGREISLAEGSELFAAVAFFMPAFAIAAIYSIVRERRVAPMLIVSFVVIGILGSLTLIFHDKTFFYMKPTIAYALFGAVLTAGLATGRNFLKTAFDGALHLPDRAWRTLTKRYAVFFFLLAAIHEVLWRWLMRDCDIAAAAKCSGEPVWVNLKLFGFTGINIVFAIVQAPFISRHMEKSPSPASTDASGD